jgi:5-methylcytosine-specific restriction endonuclease McrA
MRDFRPLAAMSVEERRDSLLAIADIPDEAFNVALDYCLVNGMKAWMTFRLRPNCLDCGIKVAIGHARCKPCSGRNRANPPRHCADCGTGISRTASRCLACWNILQDKGKSRERTKFNASKAWADARTACFERDDYTCQMCAVRGGELNAHHIKYWSDAPDLRLTLSNLVTYCRKCHMVAHGWSVDA